MFNMVHLVDFFSFIVTPSFDDAEAANDIFVLAPALFDIKFIKCLYEILVITFLNITGITVSPPAPLIFNKIL